MTYPTKAELIERYGEPDDLADVGECDNRDRAEWAWRAIKAFMRAVYPSGSGYDRAAFEDESTGVMEEVVGDLVCDLMHFITFCGADPDVTISYGQRHFENEAGLGYDEPERVAVDESQRIEVIHSRHPDEGCDVQVFVDGQPVASDVYDIDPGRGYVRADWDEGTASLCASATPHVAEELRRQRDEAADNSPYVQDDPSH